MEQNRETRSDRLLPESGSPVREERIHQTRSPGMMSKEDRHKFRSDRGRDVTKNKNKDSRSLSQIEDDIRIRRRELVKTVNVIQDRLTMENITGEVMESAKDVVSQSSDKIVETIKQHPLPASLIGAGLGWLVYEIATSGSRSRSYRRGSIPRSRGSYMYGAESDALYGRDDYGFEDDDDFEMEESRRFKSSYSNGGKEGVFKRLKKKASEMGDKTSHLKDEMESKGRHLGERAHEMSDYARERAREARESLRYGREYADESVREHPMISGLVGLAFGAALGFLIPESRKERRLMGDTREKFMSRARELGNETMEKARDNFNEVKGEVKETLNKAGEKVSKEVDRNKSSSGRDSSEGKAFNS